MRRMIVLALVLVVFMFATTIATATSSIPKINTLYQTLGIENVVPCGDPIDAHGPPGAPV